MNAVISAAFSRTGAVMLLLGLLIFVGYNAHNAIPKEAKPDIDIPVAYVSVGYEGISPEDAERLLIKPLEKQLRTVEGLDRMTAVAAEGYGSVSLEFAAGENIDQALIDVRQAVEDAKPDLPDDADEPKVTEVSLSLFWRPCQACLRLKLVVTGTRFWKSWLMRQRSRPTALIRQR